jgi:hypothetical protein
MVIQPWQRTVCEPVSFGDKILAATETKITALNQYGAYMWETPLQGVSGLAASDIIYVSDTTGIQALNANGSLL